MNGVSIEVVSPAAESVVLLGLAEGVWVGWGWGWVRATGSATVGATGTGNATVARLLLGLCITPYRVRSECGTHMVSGEAG